MKLSFWFIIILIGFCSCATRRLQPADLFTIQANENLNMKQLQKRLQYGKILRPDVSGDSLVLAVRKGIPKVYIRYMTAYVDTVNHHLRQMSQEERVVVCMAFSAQSIETLVLNGFVRLQDSLPELILSWQEAVDLGIKDNYIEFQNILLPAVGSAFSSAKNKDEELFRNMQYIYGMPRSLFWSGYYFNESAGDYYNQLMRAILKLNRLSKK